MTIDLETERQERLRMQLQLLANKLAQSTAVACQALLAVEHQNWRSARSALSGIPRTWTNQLRRLQLLLDLQLKGDSQ